MILPERFPEKWASGWGEDECGVYMGFTLNGIHQKFRWIPPGTFMMGSPENEKERSDSEQQHEVTLTRGFWLAETTCTQALWTEVMGHNPSHIKGEERPVENVSWADVQQFIQKLEARKTGLNARLPTEAEWEYACRVGTTTPFWFGENITTDQVNYNGNYPYAEAEKGQYREETVPVKELPANAWGLYQMHGNVYEWCADWYGDYPSVPVTDPQGLEFGAYRVLRGGSWISYGRYVRSAYRAYGHPGFHDVLNGFRLALGQKAY